MSQFKMILFGLLMLPVIAVAGIDESADLSYSGGADRMAHELDSSTRQAEADIAYIKKTCSRNPNHSVCANAKQRIEANREQIARNNLMSNQVRTIFSEASTQEAIDAERIKEASLKKCLYATLVACSFATGGGDGGMAASKAAGQNLQQRYNVLKVNDSQPDRAPGSSDD